MNGLTQPVTFQLVVTRHNAAEIFAVSSGQGWALPEVSIDPRRRFAEQLTQKIKSNWGIDTYCLSISGSPAARGAAQVRRAAMETASSCDVLAPSTRWFSRTRARLETNGLSEQLIQSLREYEEGDTEMRGPFSKPGWMGKLRRWIEIQLDPLGLQLSSGFRQLNASDSFSLIRFETERAAVWFKATGSPKKHELPVTTFLASHFPRYVPTMLAIHHDWNGWLSSEVRGPSLAESGELWAWEQTARALADLQIASIGKVDALLGAQARDQRLPRLASLIDPFVVRMKELMLTQEKQSPAPLTATELDLLGASLREACQFLEGCHVEDTIGHSDLNPDNVLIEKEGCVFLDWAEGCVGNPLLTFEYLRQFLTRSGAGAPAAASDRLTNAYLRPWASLYSLKELRRALEFTPLLAVFAYAVAADAWCSVDPGGQPIVAAYLRSLTRRMFREALRLAERSEPCLA